MLTFHGWVQPQFADVYVCHATWASVVTYPTGTVRIKQWYIQVAVDGSAARMYAKQGKEPLLRLFRARIRSAVDRATDLIESVNKTGCIVETRRGRKRARQIAHISWMHDRELSKAVLSVERTA